MNNKDIRNKIKRYKELKADIVDIDIRIAEKERECIGISEMPQGERITPTYKITSSVESQAEKHMEEVEKLKNIKFIKENKVKRIDNALSILDETQRKIVESVLIDRKKYCDVEEELCLSYSRIKQLEIIAIIKMKKYM